MYKEPTFFAQFNSEAEYCQALLVAKEQLENHGIDVNSFLSDHPVKFRIHFYRSPLHAGTILPVFFQKYVQSTSSKVAGDIANQRYIERGKTHKLGRQHNVLFNGAMSVGWEDISSDGDLQSSWLDERSRLLDRANASIVVTEKKKFFVTDVFRFENKNCTESFNQLLSKHNGLVIGEAHNEMLPKKYLIDNMPNFKMQGVKTLFFEHLLYEDHQVFLDQWLANPQDGMPIELKLYVNNLDKGNSIDKNYPYNFKGVLESAILNGIRIIAMDSSFSYLRADSVHVARSRDRYLLMNYQAKLIIETNTDQSKFLVFCGYCHLGYRQPSGISKNKYILGIDILLGLPTVVIKVDYQSKKNAELGDNNIQADIVICDRDQKYQSPAYKAILKGELNIAIELMSHHSPIECLNIVEHLFEETFSDKFIALDTKIDNFNKIISLLRQQILHTKINDVEQLKEFSTKLYAIIFDVFYDSCIRNENMLNALAEILELITENIKNNLGLTTIFADKCYDKLYERRLLAVGKNQLDKMLLKFIYTHAPKLLDDNRSDAKANHMSLLRNIRENLPALTSSTHQKRGYQSASPAEKIFTMSDDFDGSAPKPIKSKSKCFGCCSWMTRSKSTQDDTSILLTDNSIVNN